MWWLDRHLPKLAQSASLLLLLLPARRLSKGMPTATQWRWSNSNVPFHFRGSFHETIVLSSRTLSPPPVRHQDKRTCPSTHATPTPYKEPQENHGDRA